MRTKRDTTVKGHPKYQAYANGVIRGPNMGLAYNDEEDMPMFFDQEKERAMFILWVEIQPNNWRPLAFDAAEMMGQAWGAPEDYVAGTNPNGDPMDVSLKNLIMPPGWNADESKDTQGENPFPCPHCDKRFKSKGWVGRHIGTEHPEKVESCQQV